MASGGPSRHTLLTLYLPAFILAMGQGIIAPALPVYARSFDVSFGIASLVVIVHMAGGAAATLPTGYLADRVGRRAIVLVGPALVALASILAAFAQSFPELLVYRFVGGWAAQMWLLGRVTIIADTGGAHRGRDIGGMFATDGAGRLVGPAVGGFLAAWDIRAPFVLHGIVALLALLPNLLLLKETRPIRQPRVEGSGASAHAGVRSLLSPFVTWAMLLLLCSVLMSFLARGTLYGGSVNLYAVYVYDIGPETLGLIGVAAGVVGIPLTFAGGRLMDRVGRKGIVVPGFCALALALGGLALTAHAHSPFLVFVAAWLCVHGCNSFTSGFMQTIGADVAPVHARGTFFGVWRLASEVGVFLSPAVFAVLSEQVSYGVAFVFLSLAAVTAALLLAAQVTDTLESTPESRHATGEAVA